MHTSSEVISSSLVRLLLLIVIKQGHCVEQLRKYTKGWLNGGEKKKKKAVALVFIGGDGVEGVRKQRWQGDFDPKQTESSGVREWGESTSGCWSYCGGRTGRTGTDQLKLFNPHWKPRQDQTEFSQIPPKIALLTMMPQRFSSLISLHYHKWHCGSLCLIKQQQMHYNLFMSMLMNYSPDRKHLDSLDTLTHYPLCPGACGAAYWIWNKTGYHIKVQLVYINI